jgi:tetratricopeptide (TPR) repeat protein
MDIYGTRDNRDFFRVFNVTFISILFFLLLSCHLETISDFKSVQQKLSLLKKQNNYEEAIKFLHKNSEKIPENEFEISKELAFLYGKIGRYEKSFEIWQEGHRKGFFYGIFPHFPVYEPFKNYDNFKFIVKEDMRIRKDALDKSKIKYEVILPIDYDSQKLYPLMIILHGGGSTIEKAKLNWKSGILNRDYIQVFFQSYLFYDMKSFGWGIADQKARKEIKQSYHEILQEFNVDRNIIITGGISAGAYTAMDLALNNIIQVKGFIAVCPDIEMKDFDVQKIVEAGRIGMKGIIISGENDYSLKRQKEIVDIFKDVQFPHQFHVIPNMGHEYPDHFEDKLLTLLSFFSGNHEAES